MSEGKRQFGDAEDSVDGTVIETEEVLDRHVEHSRALAPSRRAVEGKLIGA